jgi:hypothetical protein
MPKFTRTEVKNLRAELEATLKEFGQKHGVEVDVGRITFGETFTTKLTLTKGQSLRDIQNRKKAEQFEAHFHLHKIPSRFLDKPFTYKGKEHKLIGFNHRAKKYPIEYELEGKPYKCTVDYIVNIFEKVNPQVFV